MEATFLHLQPGPVPTSTALALVLTALDNCGHTSIADHANNAVCAAIEAGSAGSTLLLLEEV